MIPSGKKGRSGFLIIGVAVMLCLAYVFRGAPTEQSVNFVLGDRAKDVTALTVAYEGEGHEVEREATFHFEKSAAPRVVHHEPRLKNGPYDISIVAETDHTVTLRRKIELGGNAISIEVGSALQ